MTVPAEPTAPRPVVVRATPADHEALTHLWQLFRHDLSAVTGTLPDSRGRYRDERLRAALAGDAGWRAYLLRLALLHVLAVDGLVAGRWRWTAGPRRLDVATAWARPASPAEEAALAERAAEAAAWWGLELRAG